VGPGIPFFAGAAVRIAVLIDFGQALPDGRGHFPAVDQLLFSRRKCQQKLVLEFGKRTVRHAVGAGNTRK